MVTLSYRKKLDKEFPGFILDIVDLYKTNREYDHSYRGYIFNKQYIGKGLLISNIYYNKLVNNSKNMVEVLKHFKVEYEFENRFLLGIIPLHFKNEKTIENALNALYDILVQLKVDFIKTNNIENFKIAYENVDYMNMDSHFADTGFDANQHIISNDTFIDVFLGTIMLSSIINSENTN